jgi:hypothetical protein
MAIHPVFHGGENGVAQGVLQPAFDARRMLPPVIEP